MDAVIVSGARTPVGRAVKGALRATRPDDLAAVAIKAAVERAKGLDPAAIEDVILGCAMPEAAQGLNIGRIAALRAGLPVEVPGQTVNRFCASGLQTIALAAQQIMIGQAEVIVAGGVESMSSVGMSGNVFSPNPALVELSPEVYMPMGLTAEQVAREYRVSREDQDAFALGSHQKALAAIDAGRFVDEIVPVEVETTGFVEGAPVTTRSTFAVDESPRRDTTLEALAQLKPVFAAGGTVTAGNASPMNDGAAAVVVMSRERAEALGLKPLARIVAHATHAQEPNWFATAPVGATKKLLAKTGWSVGDVDLWEINEAGMGAAGVFENLLV